MSCIERWDLTLRFDPGLTLAPPCMAMLFFVVLACFITLAPLPAVAQRASAFDPRVKQFIVHDAARIRIDNVRVIDGTGAPAQPGQSLLVENGRILRIGPRSALANAASHPVMAGAGASVGPA